MSRIPDKHRRSTRLRGYDYSEAGAYFVTVCTCNRACLFGAIVDDVMRLNYLGEIVQRAWLQTAVIRPNITLDAFVVMPNHVHGIIIIQQQMPRRGVLQYAPTTNAQCAPASPIRASSFDSPSQTIGAVVRGFKSSVTTAIRKMNGGFEGNIWQRNFHDRIIRDDEELHRIREYIHMNPLQWKHDQHNEHSL